MKSSARICFALAVSIGVWGGTVTAQAPAKRPMTFADLMAMKRVSDPQISPSGKWVMFSVTDVSLDMNTKVNHLWVVPIAGGAEQQLTFGDGESNGRFSPDGKWFSLTMKDQIYLASWDEAKGTVGKAVELTHVTGGADGAIWSPDSKRQMFVAEVYPECSVRGGGAAPTSQTRDVGHPGVVVAGTVDVAAWKGAEAAGWAEEDACDKAKDEVAGKDPVKGELWEGLLYRHWDHYTGAKRSHVLVVSATDGNAVRDLTPASAVGDAETPTYFVSGPTEYAWAPDSKEIAYVANLDPVPAASTNNDVFTLRLDEPGAKAVKVSTSPGSDDAPAYSPDGKWLAFRSQARGGFESDKFRLMLFDREKKTIKDVLPRFDRWVDEFVWAGDSMAIYFASGTSGSEQIFSVDQNGKSLCWRTWLGSVRDIEWGEYGDLRVSLDGHSLVSTRMTVSRPAEVFVMHLGVDSGINVDSFGYANPGYRAPMPGTIESAKYAMSKVEQLTHLNQQVLNQFQIWGGGPHEVEPMESFWFTGAEGTKVEGFLLKPPNFDPAKKYPVKFLMHGGPQTAWGDSWSYRWNWELMAASGYVVVGINRRGSTGYGQKFVDEVSGDWGGRAYGDLMKGLDYAEAKFPFIDKTRECALGASYGGFMADWVLTHTNRFKCIVTHDGMYDPESAWGDTEEMWFNEWEFRRPEDFPKGWDGFERPAAGAAPPTSQSRDVGHPDLGHPAEPWRYAGLPADQDPFRKWSPMRFIQNAKTPTLVIHSQKDYRLDVSQGMALFTALQRLGVPSEMLYFPDEGHWVLKPRNAEQWNAVVGDWCDRWTHSNKYAETR